MSFWEVLLIGAALSMDAFAVCIAASMTYIDLTKLKKLSMPVMFGLFQGVMPILGFFSGSLFSSIIKKYSGIVSFLILGFIGVSMIRESFCGEEEAKPKTLTLKLLFIQAVATSIDAFAVGVSFAARSVSIYFSSLIIAVTTFLLSIFALFIGAKAGQKLGRRAEIIGGIILIIIGVKALF